MQVRPVKEALEATVVKEDKAGRHVDIATLVVTETMALQAER